MYIENDITSFGVEQTHMRRHGEHFQGIRHSGDRLSDVYRFQQVKMHVKGIPGVWDQHRQKYNILIQ